MSDTTCQQCPGNTVVDQEPAAQCECLDGYFRNDENVQPSTACTREFNVNMYNVYDSPFLLVNYDRLLSDTT